MTNLVENPSFDNVVQLETTTAALGGPGGPMNAQAQALLNRTAYLATQKANSADLAASSGAGLMGVIQSGAGAVLRTAQEKLRANVSVMDFGAIGDGVADDTAGLTAAVAQAYSTGKPLYWNGEICLTTATIPNLHDVRHVGKGSVIRGAGTFSISAVSGLENVIYAAKTGNDANDGLSAAQALLTIQAAVNALEKYRPLNGSWAIEIAIGDYPEAVTLPAFLNPNSSYLEIRGPSVATVQTTPTVTITYPGSGSVGMDCNSGNVVKVKDIKFVGWKGAAITGLNVDDHSILWAYNVHALRCRQGIVGNGAKLYIQGGRLTGIDGWTTGAFPVGGGSVGVVNYAGGVCTIGYGATSLATGTIIETMAQAGYEGKAHTHCVASYVTFQSNELAVWCYSNARFDERANDYKKNELVHKLQKGFLSKDLSLPSNYHLGETYEQAPGDVGDGNFESYRFLQYSAEDATIHANAIGGLDICRSRASTTQTTTATPVMARLLATIYAGTFTVAPNGKYIEVFLCGTTTGAAGTKTVTLNLGATVLTTLTVATGTQTWTAKVTIWASNSTSQIVITEAVGATATAVRATKVTTMTADQDLAVYQTIPGAADTALLHECRVIQWG